MGSTTAIKAWHTGHRCSSRESGCSSPGEVLALQRGAPSAHLVVEDAPHGLHDGALLHGPRRARRQQRRVQEVAAQQASPVDCLSMPFRSRVWHWLLQ